MYLIQWDDRTKSIAEGKPWAPTQVNVENLASRSRPKDR